MRNDSPVKFTQEDFKDFFENEGYTVTLDNYSRYIYAELKKNNIKHQITYGDYGLEINYTGQVRKLSTLLKRVNFKQHRNEMENQKKVNGVELLENFQKAFELLDINFEEHQISHSWGTYGISGAHATIYLNKLQSGFTSNEKINISITEDSKISYNFKLNNTDHFDFVKTFVRGFEENFIATSL